MKIPDWRTLVLSPGVLPEPLADDNRIVLWLPGEREGKQQHWERLSTVARAEATVDQGVCAIPATSVRARQHVRGFLGKLFALTRTATGGQTWLLPNGQSAEQWGERQTGLWLVWAEGDTLPLDARRLQARWPGSQRLRQLGENLFLVAGVEAPVPAREGEQTPLPADPREQVEQLLAGARQSGDRRRQALALTDLGVIALHAGHPLRAAALLEEALGIVRQLGERSWERDVVGNLGLAHLDAGRPQEALALFDQELADARIDGDSLGEKRALEHLGHAHRNLSDFPRAVAALEQALLLARAVHDGQHEADLLWSLAILRAELDEPEQAIAHAQAAVDRLEQLRQPQARWLADDVEKYRLGEAADGLRTAAAPRLGVPSGPALSEEIVAGAWTASPGPRPGREPAVSGPGLLRRAFSAAKAMARFIGSGCKTVPAEARRRRLQMCTACEHHTGVRCRVCGCFTSAKAWLPHEQCPLGKWPG